MEAGRVWRPQCSICYEALHPDTTNALLCGHTFHEACITKWLGVYESRTCPFCGLRCDKDHLVHVRFDIPDTEEGSTGAAHVNQGVVDRLAALRRRKDEAPPTIDADRELIEVHDDEGFEMQDFPISRVLGFCGLLPGRDQDTPLITVFVTNTLIALLLQAAIALGPYRNDKDLREISPPVFAVYIFCSLVSTWMVCYVNWPYSSRIIVGIRNFTFFI